MGEEFVEDPNTKVKIGDKIKVRVIKVDDQGKIGLSMNLDPASDEKKKERRSNGGDRRSGARNYQSRGRRNFDRGRRSGGGRSSGPHFPTSRYFTDNQSSGDSRDKKNFGR